MDRKDFIKSGLMGGAAMLGSQMLKKNDKGLTMNNSIPEHNFKFNYAPTSGLFTLLGGDSLINQLDFFSKVGFKGLTDDGMRRRKISEQKKIGQQLKRLDLKMGVFGGHTYYWDQPTLTIDDKDFQKEFLDDIKSSIKIAKRINGKWMTVMPGILDLSMELEYQTANVIETLRKACDILEPHGLVMVLEPINRNYPGLFLKTVPQAYSICRAVDSPSCKILYDLYHQQITGGNLIKNIDLAWDEIGCLQVADNPGRNEPYSGEINYRNIFKHLHKKGYDGIIGMEHGKSKKGKKGEQAVIDAYVRADNF